MFLVVPHVPTRAGNIRNIRNRVHPQYIVEDLSLMELSSCSTYTRFSTINILTVPLVIINSYHQSPLVPFPTDIHRSPYTQNVERFSHTLRTLSVSVDPILNILNVPSPSRNTKNN